MRKLIERWRSWRLRRTDAAMVRHGMRCVACFVTITHGQLAALCPVGMKIMRRRFRLCGIKVDPARCPCANCTAARGPERAAN